MVGQVDHDAFGVHAERGGDELGVHGVDQVCEAGAAEHAGRDSGRVQAMADIGGRCGCPPGFGAFGDDDVRVGCALVVAVGQATLQDLPAGRVERHWMRALAQADRSGIDVQVGDLHVPDLAAGGSVQQGEDAQQRLVGMGIATGGPASEQVALLAEDQGLAGEAPGRGGGQPVGGVGQDDLAGAGEAEELPQHGQPSFAVFRQRGEKRLDVVHVGERPVQFAALVCEEPGEVTDGGQGGLDGVIGAGLGAGAAGALPGGEHVTAESAGCRTQRGRDSVDAPLAPPGGEPLGLVSG